MKIQYEEWNPSKASLEISSDSINEDDKKYHVKKAVKALAEVRDNLEILPEGEQDIDDISVNIVKAIDCGLDYLGLNNPDDIED